MNPQICSVQVGIKSVRDITIYPLSISDQLKLSEDISEILGKLSTIDKLGEEEVIKEFINLIRVNLAKILSYVLDEKEEIDFGELTNTQLSEIATIIYSVNYKDVLGNLKDLIQKAKTQLPGMRSSQESVTPPATE